MRFKWIVAVWAMPFEFNEPPSFSARKIRVAAGFSLRRSGALYGDWDGNQSESQLWLGLACVCVRDCNQNNTPQGVELEAVPAKFHRRNFHIVRICQVGSAETQRRYPTDSSIDVRAMAHSLAPAHFSRGQHRFLLKNSLRIHSREECDVFSGV